MDCQGLYDLTSNYEAIDAIVTLCGLKMSKVDVDAYIVDSYSDLQEVPISKIKKNCQKKASIQPKKKQYHQNADTDEDGICKYSKPGALNILRSFSKVQKNLRD